MVGEAFDGVLDPRKLRALAIRPDFCVGLEQRPCGFKSVGQFGGNDDVLWRHDVDAMRQRGPDEVGVD